MWKCRRRLGLIDEGEEVNWVLFNCALDMDDSG